MSTRDQEIARQLGQAQELLGQHRRTLASLVEDALRNDATAHAAMYQEVHGELAKAFGALGNAWEVMSEGDPEYWASVPLDSGFSGS